MMQQHVSTIELIVVVILIAYCITMVLYKLKHKKKSWILYFAFGLLVLPLFHSLLQITTLTLINLGKLSWFLQLIFIFAILIVVAYISVKLKDAEEYLDKK